jgi:hypothetical protein
MTHILRIGAWAKGHARNVLSLLFPRGVDGLRIPACL